MTPEQLVACRIFEQAIADYRKLRAKKATRLNEGVSGKFSIRDIERFFNSVWCDKLLELMQSDLTGRDILGKIMAQCA